MSGNAASVCDGGKICGKLPNRQWETSHKRQKRGSTKLATSKIRGARLRKMLAAWAVLAGAISTPAMGQTQIAAQGAWFVECATNRMTDKHDCGVKTRLSSGKAPVYELAFSYQMGAAMFFGIGSPSPQRVLARVDKNPAASLDICTRGVCLMKVGDAPRLLQQMRAGSTLLVEFIGPSIGGGRLPGEPIEVSLSGFDAMYKRAAAEQR